MRLKVLFHFIAAILFIIHVAMDDMLFGHNTINHI